MQKLIIFTGNVGTGKSLIASKYAKDGYVVVNMDSITTMVHGGEYGLYDPAKRGIYHESETAAIIAALEGGCSVVVDRTNMKRSDRARYLNFGGLFNNLRFISIDWGPGDGASLSRRLKQPNGIPESQWTSVHEYMAKSYEKPTHDEGFDQCLTGHSKYYFYAVDFDGTIVVYDFPGIGQPIEPMVEKMRGWWTDKTRIIIIWTCRTGNNLNEMKKWLLENKVPFDFINENPLVGWGSPKIFANEYHDDKNAPKPQEKTD